MSVPPAQAWKVFTDVERIAPLLPGAQLQEIEGDEFRGIVKVKVGPIQAQYKGVATFLEQDEAAGKVVLKASGRDTRGQGNANATITATMVADGDGTKVSVVTDLTITGKVAQFGRGVLADVSAKLLGQFVDALEADLEKGGVPEAGAPAPSEPASGGGVPGPSSSNPPTEDAGAAAAGEALVSDDPEADAGTTPSSPTEGLEAVVADGPVGGGTTAPPLSPPSSEGSPTLRRIESAEPEPVDLLDAAGSSVAKRAIPAAGVLALVVFIVLRRRAKARRRAAARLRALPAQIDVPSWDDVKGHLPALPDPDELRKLGRKAAKKARKQALKRAAKTRALAATQVEHAREAGVEAAAKLGRRQAKAARRQAEAARKQALAARTAGRRAVAQAQHSLPQVPSRH
ncbi:SRPBCC family protein [Acidiferrimicrobium sp. IK]|uniref:SRPBCC family protein n=1 Tax=Acidiferrimicrobium sp. IK TaxID=2871700 RepID=UPI0021CB2145|nr:SRPBCC family protein [Acidiferrimicrobium sp. IK]MCU4187068.1 SRPBCC family protein [Acidiferrimicrobium sp. IK]